MIIINTEGKNLLRSDSTYNWSVQNPVLSENELVIEVDAVGVSFKVGDGITKWKELPYCAGAKSCPYQIGDIYTTLSTTKPSTRWINTTWEELPAGRVMIAQGTYIEDSKEYDFSAGFTGGEARHELTQEEMAEHTHTRGTMNITGFVASFPHDTDNMWAKDANGNYGPQGAFYASGSARTGRSDGREGPSSAFDASRSWTGETSSVGASKGHNTLQPYLCVYMYKRTG